MVDIKEKAIFGKRPDQTLCEDGIFISDDFIAVIDGVTSKGKQKWQGKFTSGGYAKEIIISTLKTMPRDVTMPDFFDAVNTALSDAYVKDIENDNITEWLRACMVVYSDFHSQIWSVGDCACMINGKLFDHGKKIDDLVSALRSFVLYDAIKNGMTESEIANDDIGRAAIIPFINRQLDFENDYDTPFGYPVLNGHGFDVRGCVTYDVIRGDTVVLASDGYPTLCTTLEESEQKLKEMLTDDPLCYKKYLSTKGVSPENASFDDRTYIKFNIV